MAGRYATALFELARDANAIDPVKADLERFDALVAESADLERLVRSPVFSADEQLHALVCRRCACAGIGGLAAQFLKLATVKPPTLFAVRDMVRGIPRVGRRAQRRDHGGSHRRRNSSRTTTSPHCAPRSRLSAARTSISISRSIPPSLAG